MEDWQRDFEWLRVRHAIKKMFGKPELPEMDAILFLIGLQEYGRPKPDFTKEEKQDLMHIAVCSLFEQDGYYEFVGRDEDGWPHYEQRMNIDISGLFSQESALKDRIIKYFADTISQEHITHENQ